jgi:hypothetical protein
MKHIPKLLVGGYVLMGIGLLGYVGSPALADPLKSSNFQFTETSLGGNGLLNAQSANYQAAGSGAILGIGNSAGVDFQLNAGNLTTNDPALSFAVNSSNVNFGSFSAGYGNGQLPGIKLYELWIRSPDLRHAADQRQPYYYSDVCYGSLSGGGRAVWYQFGRQYIAGFTWLQSRSWTIWFWFGVSQLWYG